MNKEKKNLPLENLVLAKSDKKQIKEFLLSLGKWKNINSGYTFFYKCLRGAKNDEGILDKLIEFLGIDTDEFQKAIDETKSIIQEDKEQKRNEDEQKARMILYKEGKRFLPHTELIYKSLGGGMGWAYSFGAFRKKTLEEGLDKKIQKILSKTEETLTEEFILYINESEEIDVLKEIGKEIKKHYLENADNHLVEILGYFVYPTFDSTSSYKNYTGRIEYDESGLICYIGNKAKLRVQHVSEWEDWNETTEENERIRNKFRGFNGDE